jgi:hypothetical protein
MQIPQTTYNNVPAEAYNGTFCLMGPAAPAAAGVGPGQCQLIPDGTLVDALSELAGVAVMDLARSPFSGTSNTASGSGQYQVGDDVPCQRRGRVWMYSENAVTAGDPVYVRTTAASTNVTGQVRDGAAGSFVLHPTAVFMNTTTGAGIALVEIK